MAAGIEDVVEEVVMVVVVVVVVVEVAAVVIVVVGVGVVEGVFGERGSTVSGGMVVVVVVGQVTLKQRGTLRKQEGGPRGTHCERQKVLVSAAPGRMRMQVASGFHKDKSGTGPSMVLPERSK